MKKLFIILSLLIIPIITGCYTDTIEEMSSVKFQIPIYFHQDYHNKNVPDTSDEFSNLYEYETYTQNKDRVKKAEVFQFNYWVDSLVLENGTVYDPDIHELSVEYLRFYIIFAEPKSPELEKSKDPDDFYIPDDAERYILGEYNTIDVSAYYRNPEFIIDVEEETSSIISDLLKNKPYFYVVTETGPINGGDYTFPFIKSRFDLVIRLDVEI